MSKKNILILGADGRNGLATAGALHGHGYRLIGLGVRSNSTALRFIQGGSKPAVLDEMVFVRRHSEQDVSSFIDELERTIVDLGVDVLIPTGTQYTMWVAESKARLSRSCIVPLESHEKMEALHDKYRVMRLCQSMGIPVPKTVLIENRVTLDKVKDTAEYPAVLKARKGAGNDGVWVVKSADELERIYAQEIEAELSGHTSAKDRSKPMLQEFVQGELHDVTSFSVKGRPCAVLSQIRIMTAPLSGGGGIVNQTTDNREIKDMAEAIIREVEWDGILEFDFIIDSRLGKPRLLEINPKIWGTTWLTVQAGFNMPLYLLKQALGEPYEVAEKYTVGLRARWPSLEMGTWGERPVSVGVYSRRVWRFVKLFGDRRMVYDLRLLGIKALLGNVLCSLLGRTYRVLDPSSRRAAGSGSR